MKFKNLIFLLLIIYSCNSYSSDYYRGKVIKILSYTTTNQNVFIKMDGTVTGKPACSSSASYDFVFRISTDQGKAAFSQLLAAYNTGGKIQVEGTGDCTLSSSTEDLKYVYSRNDI